MEKMENTVEQEVGENRIEKIVAHDGVFHFDEVFGEAVLKDIFPESMHVRHPKDGITKIDYVKYLRTRDKNILDEAKKTKSAMLLDVGNEYDFEQYNMDHHQLEGAGERENGVKYATSGLVWKHFGKEWIKYIDTYSRQLGKNKKHIGDKDWVRHVDENARDTALTEKQIDLVWNLVDENYVQYIDSNDTGQMESITCTLSDGTKLSGKHFSLAEVVRLQNIDTHDRTTQQRFNDSVSMIRRLLLSIVYKYMDLVEGIEKIKPENYEFVSEGRAVIINQQAGPAVTSYLMDKKEEFKKVEYFAILNPQGGYSVIVNPIAEGLREYRNPDAIPKELRLGNDVENINKQLGIEEGMIFAHPAGFFALCKDVDTAKKLLEYCTKK
jgi:uncharacterized UPF0160 family protein